MPFVLKAGFSFCVSESQETLLCGFEVTSQLIVASGFLALFLQCNVLYYLSFNTNPLYFLTNMIQFLKIKLGMLTVQLPFVFCYSFLNNHFIIKVSC